jgi:hypothetical protein
MRHTLTTLLSAASAAWAMNGGDANAEADQAQLHPWSPNQTPDWIPNGVPMGEVYAAYAYVAPTHAFVPPIVVAPVIVPVPP